jgi:lauroyl/myristoyl acyltransferase
MIARMLICSENEEQNNNLTSSMLLPTRHLPFEKRSGVKYCRVGQAIEWLVNFVARAMECLLAAWCLRLLLWPAAALLAGWELFRGQPTIRQFKALPPSWLPYSSRASWIYGLWRERTHLNITKMHCLWPDRLQERLWQPSCSGLERFDAVCKGSRPIILAVLHFGPLTVLRYWLRSRGLAAAALVERPQHERSVSRRLQDRWSDQASGLTGIPHVFDLSQLKALREFLGQQRVLMVAMDTARGEQVTVAADGFSFEMSSAAVRLASWVNGVVIPCMTWSDYSLRFGIHFGNPVADELVSAKGPHDAACAQLLRECVPTLRAHPEQCSFELLSCIR